MLAARRAFARIIVLSVVVVLLVWFVQTDVSYVGVLLSTSTPISRGNAASSCCHRCTESQGEVIYQGGAEWKRYGDPTPPRPPEPVWQLFEQPGHPYVFADSLGPNSTLKMFRECCVCPVHQIGRVLILVSETRDLLLGVDPNTTVAQLSYPAKTAIMNKQYADAHGYDFVYSRPGVTATFREMMWAALEKESKASDCKFAAPLWHFNRSSLRSAPWAKLPAAWHFALEYDWIVSIDSDAVFRNMSWKLPQSLAALRPDQDYLFLSNMPFSYMMPCSGVFVVRGGDRGRKRLETWWNTISQTDRRHAYEQTALWQRITPQTWAGTQYDADFANAGVRIDVAQFYRSGGYWPVSKPHSWIVHVGSTELVGRASIFDGILEERNISLQARALPLLQQIPTALINGNAVALDMEKFNSANVSNWLEGTLDSVCTSR
ncbi:hypothetical protein Naga_100226g2 [Nannochloropsis gaditana]|uniref:Nucleotide-diphospho-sugar transferase domain-containing protein n=1 Tax=Nannochloropsis gaditana TaxID=72520 RepID=W7TMP0_9STRA|nr:hypothetical protein Naga_100226g2 [Nannochloropsis gaditana]